MTEKTREKQVALHHFAYFPGTALTAALWTVLDMTPEGRGADWYPKLDY